MIKMKRIFAVSLIAMFAVASARATIVSQENIVGKNDVGVEVVTVGGVNKVQVKSVPAFGVGVGGATSAAKTVSIPSITDLQAGQIIVVNPQTTHQTSSGYANSCTISLNGSTGAAMTYNGVAGTRYTCNYMWQAEHPAMFVYDGTNWAFIGGYDLNSTYGVMSVSEGTTGTATSSRTMRADYLKQIVQGTGSTEGLAENAVLIGYAKAETAAAVATTDTIKTAIGKLEKALDGKQATMTVDTAMSSSSTNPVQNKVVNTALSDKVSTSRKVNGHALSSDVTISASDVGLGNVDNTSDANKPISTATQTALNAKQTTANMVTVESGTGYDTTSTTTYPSMKTAAKIAADAATTAVSGASGNYVPTSRKVNGKALSSDVTLAGSDVATTGYTKASSAAAITAGDSVNVALGKLEKTLDGKQASLSAMTVAKGQEGTETTARSMTAANLKQIVQGTTGTSATNGLAPDAYLNGYAKAETAAAIATTDTIKTAIGKLEKALDGKQATMTVDTAMSSSSTNPVQNKVVNTALSDKVSTSRKVNGHALSSDVTISASDVGLGNVDNTSDANKPISTATQTALDAKQNIQIGAAKSGTTASTDSGKAVVVDDNGQIAMSTSKLGSAAYTASTAYDAAGAAAAVENKLDDGASGYDINAKSLKVQGTSVLTSLSGAVLTSGAQTVGGAKTFSGAATFSSSATFNGTTKVSGANTAAGKASDGTTDVAAVSDGDVKKAVLALDSKKEEYANKYGMTTAEVSGYSTVLNDDTQKYVKYPTMAVTNQMINDSQANKVNVAITTDANSVMVRGTGGAAMKGTGSDITVAGNGAITVNHATKANQIPYGSENATTYASVWIE